MRGFESPQWQALIQGILDWQQISEHELQRPSQPRQSTAPSTDLWLAIGDETGNWDWQEQNKNRTLGVVVVVARVQDWRAALQEDLGGRRVANRMTQRLERLPSDARRQSSFHHVADAMGYDRQCGYTILQGRLSETGDHPLRCELYRNLRWLATHPRLLTLGCYGKARDFHEHLPHGEDEATALGQVYALLMGWVAPFLGPDARAICVPAKRSEDRDSRARQRAGDPRPKDPNERPKSPLRLYNSAAMSYVETLYQPWQATQPSKAELTERLDFRAFKALTQPLDDHRAASAVADMGAGLMQLSQDRRIQPEWAQWPNVRFTHLRELHP